MIVLSDHEAEVWVRAALTALATYPVPGHLAVADMTVMALRERLPVDNGGAIVEVHSRTPRDIEKEEREHGRNRE